MAGVPAILIAPFCIMSLCRAKAVPLLISNTVRIITLEVFKLRILTKSTKKICYLISPRLISAYK